MARKKSEARLAREFGFMWPIVMSLLAALLVAPKWIGFLWWEAKPNAVAPLLTTGFALLAISLLFRSGWVHVFRFWMRWITRPMAWLSTRLLLSLFFFVVLTPFVVVLRLFGKKFLDTRWRDGRASYWIARETPERELERYRRQF